MGSEVTRIQAARGGTRRRPLPVAVRSALLGLCLAFPGAAAGADTRTAEGQYRFAEGLFARRFYDLAEKEFRSFVENHAASPLAPDAMYRLIICLRNQDRKDGMFDAINDFQARWPDHALGVKLNLWRGELLFERGQYPAAEACFRRLTGHSESAVQEAATFFMGQSQEKQGKAEAAIETYRALAEKDLDGVHEYRPYALFAVALDDQRQQRHAAATAAFARLAGGEGVPAGLRQEAAYRLAESHFAQEDYDRAAAGYEGLLATFPEGPFGQEARKRLSWAYYLRGDYSQAAEAAAAWRQKYGDVFDSELDYIQAASLAGISFHAEALPLLRRLTEDPRVPADTARMAAFQEIVCLAHLKRSADTVARAAAFADAYPKAAEVPMAHYLAGRAAKDSDDVAKAADLLRRAFDGALATAPFREDAGLLLMACYEQLQRPGDAAAVSRAIAANKDAPRRAYHLFRAGELERQAGNHEQAIRDFENLIEAFPDAGEESRAAMQHLGELYSSAGQFERAVDIVERLLSQAGSGSLRPRLLFFRGYLRYQQGDDTQAVASLQEALAERDGGEVASRARFYLGGALLRLGRSDEALTVFGEVLSLPEGERPTFPAELLFQLEALYYARNSYDVSESICRWLMSRQDGRTVYRATLRLADILVARNRLDEAETQLAELRRRLAEGSLAFPPPGARPLDEEIVAVQAEVFLLQGQIAKAAVAAERCLGNPDLDAAFLARAGWVAGEALYRQGHLAQALPHAVKVYILEDDPVYSPRAMLLALRILVALDRLPEAQRTLQELRQRYPVFAESMANAPEFRRLRGEEPQGAPAAP